MYIERILIMKVIKFILFMMLVSIYSISFSENIMDPKKIMEKVFNRTIWNDFSGDVELLLINKKDQTKIRKIKMLSMKNDKDELSMLLRFLYPADIRGTGILVIEHNGSEDDRRLYLPSLRRVQRIAASGSGGYFMSSDFTYYDIGRPKLNDWNYFYEKNKKTTDCTIVIAEAINEKVIKNTGYSKIEWCIDEKYIISNAKYFDKSKIYFKKYVTKKTELISENLFATQLYMENIITNHKSQMNFTNIKANSGINNNIFTERFLRE